MIKGCFTVLHFGELSVTIRCIESLLKLRDIEKCKILILDNGTTNSSYAKLVDRYDNNEIVLIYKSDNNLGFSRGNNYLFKKAKALEPRFVVVLNNDIVIKQKNFIGTLEKLVDKEKYYFIGPDVYKPHTGDHQAPLYKTIPTVEELETKDMSFWTKINSDTEFASEALRREIKSIWLHNLVPNIFTKLYREIRFRDENYKSYKDCCEDAVLQGSCIIVSDLYIKKENLLFEPDTGMYFEELLLALKCRTLSYHTIYTPSLHVLHYHAVATKSDMNDYYHYMKTQAERMLHAYDIYKSCVINNPWKKKDK